MFDFFNSKTKNTVGYWPQDRITWPIDHAWDRAERDTVVACLLKPVTKIGYLGSSTCRICGRMNGSEDFLDGTYTWPSGLAHYLIEHGARPPTDFVVYVLTRSRNGRQKE